MDARELRIGNYVYPDISYPESIRVCTKDFEDTTYLRPIPLTEEWLVKFGFDEDEFQDSFTYGIVKGHRILTEDVFINEQNEVYFNEFYLNIHLEYVHQLQNLYFALTGEELTIKTQNNDEI